jgi:hypothetical protein
MERTEYAQKFAKEIYNETDDQKVLDKMLKADDNEINKSSVFNLDLEKLFKTITNIWNKFETFDGITKLACILMISSSLILWCVFGILSSLYGNYLLDRFNLETRFPKLAKFIKLRRKLTMYYILFDFLIIILVCLTNFILGISILSLFFSIPFLYG